LTTYDAPFFTDGILPGGNLREGRGEADRANVVVVTKCPLNLSESARQHYRNEITKYTPAKVFFSKMDHGTVRWLHPKKSFELNQKFLLVTGIANPVPFVNHLKEMQLEFEHMKFPDHHLFTKLDIKKMRDKVKQNNLAGIVTTEKDATRFLFRGNLHEEFPIGVFPIQVVFEEKAAFDQLIFQYLKENKKAIA
jgi:tetraacyldisaccharide 4'-kinase